MTTQIIEIDGSLGEGGGQVLRSALSLSLCTGRPFRISRIRANRKKTGLMRQHLTAARAAAELCGGQLSGDEIGSPSITFKPGKVQPGEYRVSIGSAGSTMLVLQTLLPPLLTLSQKSTLILEGGTHNPMAPPFPFLEKSFLPQLNRLGPRVSATLERAGFYPAGGGLARVEIEPASTLSPLVLEKRGEPLEVRATALLSNLGRRIGEREVNLFLTEGDWPDAGTEIVEIPSPGPGNLFLIELKAPEVTEIITGFGQRNVTAEAVAAGAVTRARRYVNSGAPVGLFLADQLLIPLALAGKGAFITLPPTPHTLTNMEIIGRFLEVRFRTEEIQRGLWRVAI